MEPGRILPAVFHGKTADILQSSALPALSCGIGILYANAGCHHPEHGHSHHCPQLQQPSAATPLPGNGLYAHRLRPDTGLRMDLRQAGLPPYFPAGHLCFFCGVPPVRPFHLHSHDDGMPRHPGNRRRLPDARRTPCRPALLSPFHVRQCPEHCDDSCAAGSPSGAGAGRHHRAVRFLALDIPDQHPGWHGGPVGHSEADAGPESGSGTEIRLAGVLPLLLLRRAGYNGPLLRGRRNR